jgi:nanoRNase/pAp phosphatase (c-di-AMP/oligoRNAs hydrolase)
LIEICGADIGVSYDTNEETQITDLSIRGSSSLKTDLGKKVSKIVRMVGGTGGGHRKASGARIQTSKLMEFIRALSESP